VDSSALRYLDALAAEVAAVVGDRRIGVYPHGSWLLGDFLPERSDIDVLVVVEDALSTDEQAALATQLSEEALPCPAVGLELSVVTRAATAAPTARRIREDAKAEAARSLGGGVSLGEESGGGGGI